MLSGKKVDTSAVCSHESAKMCKNVFIVTLLTGLKGQHDVSSQLLLNHTLSRPPLDRHLLLHRPCHACDLGIDVQVLC